MPARQSSFQPDCRQCTRLAAYLDTVRANHPGYHAAPVPSFGQADAKLLIVGLAPGMHGANRTGRPFTGDFAGILLYKTLHAVGFANRPIGEAPDDGLELIDCRITNAVKCVPPGNKPVTAEIRNCNRYLAAELDQCSRTRVLLALGRIAHDAVLRALGLKLAAFRFGHGAEHKLPDGRVLIDSYHCSRYNTQTRRLTDEMFQRVIERARALTR